MATRMLNSEKKERHVKRTDRGDRLIWRPQGKSLDAAVRTGRASGRRRADGVLTLRPLPSVHRTGFKPAYRHQQVSQPFD